MAKINIKTNFVDGEKLFAQQLNNNFKAIQEGMNSDNKIIWQDGEEVLFKRYVTNDIESLPILDGSIIYDVEKGRHYIDYNGNRIQVGSSGKEVLVQDNEPTEEDNKLWIDSDFVNTMGTEVVDSLDGNETNMAPSVRVVKNNLKEYILYEGDSLSTVELKESIKGYSKLIIELTPKQYLNFLGVHYMTIIKPQNAIKYIQNNTFYDDNVKKIYTVPTSFIISNNNIITIGLNQAGVIGLDSAYIGSGNCFAVTKVIGYKEVTSNEV